MSAELNPHSESIDKQAAEWLARRDRGLTSAEQDDYLQWLHQDPRHGDAIARHEATLRRMMRLGDWKPALSDEPNPDLFAPKRRAAWRTFVVPLATAAALVIGGMLAWPAGPSAPVAAPKSYLRTNERVALSDGSLVELKDGSRIAIEFSDVARRVRLSGGEAHFKVAKDSTRPFIVDTGRVAVRAVGTEFCVRLETASVEVLVTEGKVAVDRQEIPPQFGSPVETAARVGPEDGSARRGEAQSEPPSTLRPRFGGTLLTAGQRALISLADGEPDLQVSNVTPQEIQGALAWQAPRLQFFETPLSVAIAEFNARNSPRLVLGDPDLGAVLIGGTFRADNVEGFVRTIEVTLDLWAEPRGSNELVLRRAR